MIKILNRYTLVASLMQLSYTSQAQTIVWEMKPTGYDEITCVNKNLYKVVQNGKIGLIRSDGTIVSPVESDGMTDFYENKAILTQGNVVVGCLTDKGEFHAFSKKYHTLTGQNFYSDGLLSVKDDKENLGYIDAKGISVLGFEGQYTNIKPFTEGYAVVKKKGKEQLINKDGETIPLTFKISGEIEKYYNVYNGIAYIRDPQKKYYKQELNKSESILVKYNKVKSNATDYLSRLSDVSGIKDKKPPFEKGTYKGQITFEPVAKGNLYGYKDMPVPCLFAKAEPFIDNCAIVGVNGKLGIIRYIADDKFELKQSTSEYDFYEGDNISCTFTVEIPTVWKDKNIVVSLVDEAGKAITVNKTEGTYTFNVQPTSTSEKKYAFTIDGEGLKLFESSVTYSFTKREKCKTCKEDTRYCPLQGKHPEPKVCPICKDVVSECIYKGKHPKVKLCPDCGKKITECEYEGVH